VEVHLAGNIHCGEQALARGSVTSGLIAMGQRVTWRAKHFGVWQTLTSEITSMVRPVYFLDEMVRGAFRWMRHGHYFRAVAAAETEMRDVFSFAAPLGPLGRVAERTVLRRYMGALLHERNEAVRKIAESEEWRKYIR
jgi:hypothetical protein